MREERERWEGRARAAEEEADRMQQLAMRRAQEDMEAAREAAHKEKEMAVSRVRTKGQAMAMATASGRDTSGVRRTDPRACVLCRWHARRLPSAGSLPGLVPRARRRCQRGASPVTWCPTRIVAGARGHQGGGGGARAGDGRGQI